MARGRKADAGTHEAREKIIIIANIIMNCPDLSSDAKNRVVKALYFGLGIQKKEIDLPCAENVEKKSEEIIVKKSKNKKENLSDVSGDEYFKPEDCYEAK